MPRWRVSERRGSRNPKGKSLPRLTTGEAVAKSLILHGVDTVFGIPGAHMYHFTDALARQSNRIRFVTTRHEQGAGHLAFGYAKSTGRAGVYTVVPGPGVLNSSSALSVAYGANAPVLCVTGNVMSHLIGRGRGQLHELPDQLATLRGITGYAERIDHPTEAPRVVAQAFREMPHRAGPASGDRGAVGRVRPGGRCRPRTRPQPACAAEPRHRPHRGGGEAHPGGEKPPDRRWRGRPARADGGRGAGPS